MITISESVDSVFGFHAVNVLIKKQPQRVLCLQIQEGRCDHRMQDLLVLCKAQHIRVETVTRKQLDQRVDGQHQGVIALCKNAASYNEQALFTLLDQLEEPPFLLLLDSVTDPHNLGACLRTACGAGVHAVIAPKDKSAPLNATAVKVACGGADLVPFIQVTNLVRTMKALQALGIWLYGAAGEAKTSLYETPLTGPIGMVMGAERSGLRRLTREHCDGLMTITMAAAMSSLNVSVATGVCLFEAVRQRTLLTR